MLELVAICILQPLLINNTLQISFLKTVFVFAETAPLDLETDSFYEARKGALLDKIEHGMAEELLIMSWESHVGTACRGVNWDKHSLSELRAAVTCIGGVFA